MIKVWWEGSCSHRSFSEESPSWKIPWNCRSPRTCIGRPPGTEVLTGSSASGSQSQCSPNQRFPKSPAIASWNLKSINSNRFCLWHGSNRVCLWNICFAKLDESIWAPALSLAKTGPEAKQPNHPETLEFCQGSTMQMMLFASQRSFWGLEAWHDGSSMQTHGKQSLFLCQLFTSF